MANSGEILAILLRHPPPAPAPIAYNFLVPNVQGMQNFVKAVEANNAFNVANDKPSTETPENPNTPHTPPPSPQPEKGETGEQAPLTSTEDPNEMPGSISGDNDTKQSRKASVAPNWTEISLFTAATEAFSKANTNCSIAESLERCKPIADLANSLDIRVRGYVSVALGCPYEGPDVSPQKVAEITRKLLEMGADEVSIADTTGMGTMPKTQELLKALFAAGIEPYDLAFHFHDTYGQALCNTVVCLERDIRTFDSSVGGLGGCPFSKGATGNIATEDLLHCLHSLGIQTGIDAGKMAGIGDWISKELVRPNDSRAGKALLARNSA